MRQEVRQILRMEQASLLEMPEDEFSRLIVETEQGSLFRKLYQKERLIHYQRFPGTDISSSFYQLTEEIIPDEGHLDVESLLLNKEHLICQIQRLGPEKFKRYFLFPESAMTLEEIARERGLEIPEIQKINSLIDEFAVMSEFYHPSDVASGGICYSKVASIEEDRDGFIIGYFCAYLARGRYSIDYQRFEELMTAGAFIEAEVKEARQLFKKLELINSRKDTITKILQKIVDKQALYLKCGDMKSLLPFSQKELAERIGIAPSTVSRAIRGRSIETPQAEEIPLKHFFPRPKRFRKELLRQFLETDTGLSSDEVIQTRLWEKFGVAISRRSVGNLRKELKFPSGRVRRHNVARSI